VRVQLPSGGYVCGMKGWSDNELLARAAHGPMTAEEIGKVMRRYGPDAVTQLRGTQRFKVTIVGHLLREDGRKGPHKKLYRIERTQGE
jgi:hypothetical protein